MWELSSFAVNQYSILYIRNLKFEGWYIVSLKKYREKNLFYSLNVRGIKISENICTVSGNNRSVLSFSMYVQLSLLMAETAMSCAY